MNYLNTPNLKLISITLSVCLMLVSCECSSHRAVDVSTDEPDQAYDPIEAQRDFLTKERASIEAYIKDRELEMASTGTGMHYQISNVSDEVVNPQTGDWVEYEYDVYLLNGALLYSSKEDGTGILRIDKQDAVPGLHEALKLLSPGSEGLFILPSHLAYGVGGDQEKVPPKTPLLYEIKLLQIKTEN